MRRHIYILTIAVMALMTSCLGHDEYDVYPDAAITKLVLGNVKVYYFDTDTEGKDTLVYKTIAGKYYKFNIDQKNNLVYNTDSFPYRSDLTRVLATISGTGNIYYQKFHSDGTSVDTLYTTTDSIDFSKPMNLYAQSTDGSYSRTYELRVGVHTMDPDSMKWKHYTASETNGIIDASAFVRSDTLYVLGTKGGVKGMTSANTADMAWNAFTPFSGLEDDADTEGAILHDGTFYLLDKGKLFSSSDAKVWNKVSTTHSFKRLISDAGSPYSDGKAWAISSDSNLLCSEDMVSWSEIQQIDSDFPDSRLFIFHSPLLSNKNIMRSILTGLDTDNADNRFTSVWTRLSTDSIWQEVNPSLKSPLRCPWLNNLAMIWYDGELMAFGSSGIAESDSGTIPEAFQGFWESSDHGISWRDCSKVWDEYSTWRYKMQFPDNLKGNTDSFSFATDFHGYIWIITDNSGIWRGAVNKMVK